MLRSREMLWLARGVGLPLQCGEAYCRMPVLPLPLKRVRAYRNKTALSVPAPAQNDCVAGVPICIEDVPATVGWRDTYRTTEPQQLKPQHQQNQNTKLRKTRTLVFAKTPIAAPKVSWNRADDASITCNVRGSHAHGEKIRPCRCDGESTM